MAENDSQQNTGKKIGVSQIGSQFQRTCRARAGTGSGNPR